MKRKIKEHFGDEIVITEIHGKSNVVTFRKTAKSILQQFYTGKQSQDRRYEKLELISTAAKLIKSDIREQEATKLVYPRTSDLASRQANVEYVPETLPTFLKLIFRENDVDFKVASIGLKI